MIVARIFLALAILSIAARAADRATQLNLDDEVIEEVSKQSSESLMQLSEKDDRNARVHLYQRREHFEEEIGETLSEILEEQ